MLRKSTETVVPLDIQETANEQSSERRRTSTLMEAMRRFSSKTKLSTPRLDQLRKPFLALNKSSKVNIEPWPSATNLVHLSDPQKTDSICFRRSERDSAIRRTASFNIPVIDVRRPSEDDLGEDDGLVLSRGIINSAFSQETISNSTSRTCNCTENNSCNFNFDVCQFKCRHERICEHLECQSSRQCSDFPRRRLNSYPKVLTHRRKSIESGRWKKGVRWKPSGNKNESKKKSRRRTVDSVPSAKKIVAFSKNSLNLSNSENNLLSSHKNCGCSSQKEKSTDDESPNEQEFNTKF